MNLLEETYEILEENNKFWKEIKYIVIDKNGVQKQLDSIAFMLAALMIDYENDCSKAKINPYIKIVGKDWWLERVVYNGIEKWAFKTTPKLQENIAFTKDKKEIENLIVNYEG